MPDHSRHPARHRFCGAWMLDAATNRHGCVACGAACGCSTCKAARPALLEVPNRCVVLGVDAARRSGWSVWYHPDGPRAVPYASGESDARRLSDSAPVVERSIGLASVLGVPAVMVVEASPFGGSTAQTTFGIGKAVGQWIMAWLAGGGKAARIIEIQPRDWRKDLWGESPPSDEARAREVREATALVGNTHKSTGPDEAPAILIGKWGMHSPQVNAVLPRKFRQVAGGEGRAA